MDPDVVALTASSSDGNLEGLVIAASCMNAHQLVQLETALLGDLCLMFVVWMLEADQATPLLSSSSLPSLREALDCLEQQMTQPSAVCQHAPVWPVVHFFHVLWSGVCCAAHLVYLFHQYLSAGSMEKGCGHCSLSLSPYCPRHFLRNDCVPHFGQSLCPFDLVIENHLFLAALSHQRTYQGTLLLGVVLEKRT